VKFHSVFIYLFDLTFPCDEVARVFVKGSGSLKVSYVSPWKLTSFETGKFEVMLDDHLWWPFSVASSSRSSCSELELERFVVAPVICACLLKSFFQASSCYLVGALIRLSLTLLILSPDILLVNLPTSSKASNLVSCLFPSALN
jgi:hypothetical protein